MGEGGDRVPGSRAESVVDRSTGAGRDAPNPPSSPPTPAAPERGAPHPPRTTAPAAPRASRAPPWLAELTNALFGRRFPRTDAALVTLALVDVLALLLRRELLLPDPYARWIVWFDRGALAIFAVEYGVSVLRAEERARFVRATWYDLVGLVPLPIAALRVFRLLRVPHVLFWGSRYPARADREFGGAYAVALFRRYEPIIVEDLTDPLLVRLLQILREALAKGRYAQTVGESLNARRDRVHGVVVRALREKRALRVALAAPLAEGALRAAEDQLVDVVVAVLTDPELDAVLKESVDESLAELQRKLAQKSYLEAL